MLALFKALFKKGKKGSPSPVTASEEDPSKGIPDSTNVPSESSSGKSNPTANVRKGVHTESDTSPSVIHKAGQATSQPPAPPPRPAAAQGQGQTFLLPTSLGQPGNTRRSTERYSFARESRVEDITVEMVLNERGEIPRDQNGNTALHILAYEGDLEGVKKLLERDRVPADVRNYQDWTPLMCAAAGGWAPVASLLLAAGCDPNLTNEDGNTALHEAALANAHACASFLARTPLTDPNMPNLDLNSPLHLACMAGFLESSAAIFGSGRSNPKMINNRFCTPLQAGALEGHFKLVEFLVSKGGMDPNVTNPEGSTMLHLTLAIQPRNTALLREMLGAVPGLDVNAQDRLGFTPLMRAIQKGENDAALALLAHPNVNVNVSNANQIPEEWKAAMGASALQSAPDIRRRSACFRDFRNARVNTPFNRHEVTLCLEASYWSSALHLACSLGQEDMVQRLVEQAGADVDIADSLNRSVLHVAVTSGHRRVVKYLVEQLGLEVEAREGVLGWSPLHIAVFTGSIEMVLYMLTRAGARVNSRARDGSTPFVIAKDSIEALSDRTPSGPLAVLSQRSLVQASGVGIPRKGSVEMGAVFLQPQGPSHLEPVIPEDRPSDDSLVTPREFTPVQPMSSASTSRRGDSIDAKGPGRKGPSLESNASALEFVLPAPDKETMKILAVAGSEKYRRANSETSLGVVVGPGAGIPASSSHVGAAQVAGEAAMRVASITAQAPAERLGTPEGGRTTRSCDATVSLVKTPPPKATGPGVPVWAVPTGKVDGPPDAAAPSLPPASAPLAIAPAVQPPSNPGDASFGRTHALSSSGSFKGGASMANEPLPAPGSVRALHKILEILREQGGCDKRETDGPLLLKACETGHVDQAKVLILSFSTNVNVADAQGRTPLHLCIQGGQPAHLEILRLLAQSETLEVDPLDRSGLSPLALALQLDRKEAAYLLRELGAEEPVPPQPPAASPLTPKHPLLDPRLAHLSKDAGGRPSNSIAEALVAVVASRLAPRDSEPSSSSDRSYDAGEEATSPPRSDPGASDGPQDLDRYLSHKHHHHHRPLPTDALA